MGTVLHSSALGICQRAMAILRQENRLTTITASAPTKVERSCYDAYEPSRLEVVSSYGWSFLKVDKYIHGTHAVEEDGRYSIAVPADALKILACYDIDDHKLPYTVRGNAKIYSRREIYRITYLVDDDDVSAYPALVQDAIVKTLAKNLCMEITGRPADLQLITAMAQTAVQVARTDDARTCSTGSDVYGKNHLYETMCGRRNVFARRGL